MATVNDGFGYQADVRWAAGGFLESIADECDEAAAELRAAANAYKKEAGLHCQGMKLGPISFAPEKEKRRIADRKLRLEMACLVSEAGKNDREAVEYLERALSKLS